MSIYDLIVVGGGPAGLTAASLASHAGLKTVLIEQAAFGGQIALAEEVENWPADLRTTGSDLAKRFREQAEGQRVTLLADTATGFELTSPVKSVLTGGGLRIQGRSLILCPGAIRRNDLKVPNTDLLRGTGLALDESGSIIADPDTMATNLDGVFAAGDARRKWLRKLVTAAADGAVAAYAAVQYLETSPATR